MTSQNSIPTPCASAVVVSANAEENFRAKLCELHQIFGSNLVGTYYKIGRALIDVFADKDSSKYGVNAIERVADELNMSVSNLYRCQEVAVNIKWEDIQALQDNPNVKWCHIRELVRVNPEKRLELLHELAASTTPVTVVDFKKKVEDVRAASGESGSGESDGDGGDSAAPSRASNSGGGSRTGSGHGASPLTPLKQIRSGSDKLSEQIKSALIALKDFDPDSDAVAKRMTDAINDALGCVCDLVTTAVGFVEAAEAHIANNSTKQLKETQDARAAAYAQATTVLSRLSKSINDGSLCIEGPVKDAEVPTERAAQARPRAVKKPRSRDDSAGTIAEAVAPAKAAPPVAPEVKLPPTAPEQKRVDPPKTVKSSTSSVDDEKARLREEMRKKAEQARLRMKEKAQAKGKDA